uniref:Uncharacterized protein n=1 Tax=Anguilla anguilla TaxID=7936 RepID=A0A0E9R6X8_ANGAN
MLVFSFSVSFTSGGYTSSMACPSSRSNVTTQTHSSQEEKRAHGRREAMFSAPFSVLP